MNSKKTPSFDTLAADLAQLLGLVDDSKKSRGMQYLVEQVLARHRKLQIKMYQEQGHDLPHIHVNYGKETHQAGYSIDPAVRLNGSLDRAYEKTVLAWINDNRARLLEIWTTLNDGRDAKPLIAELGGLD